MTCPACGCSPCCSYGPCFSCSASRNLNTVKKGKCKECKRTKELTIHETCWPCHLGRINLNTMIEVRKKS